MFGFGCRPRPTTSDDTYRAIQRDEARMSRALAVIDGAQSCGTAQSAADSVCDARQALCRRVDETGDADAQARCLRAADTCALARTRADGMCAAREIRQAP
jgi:hypothetical protein